MGVILFAGLIRVSFVLSEGNSNAPKKLRLENKKGARSLINVNNLWEGNAMKRVNKIGMIGGYGVEYFLSEQFSLGGEVSMNLVMNKWKNENQGEYDYDNNENISEDYRLTAGAVFTQFIFNYYFD
jgi:hypothetical protein